jgi:hypothetical protein
MNYFGDVQMEVLKAYLLITGEPMGYHIEHLRMQINNTADINHFKVFRYRYKLIDALRRPRNSIKYIS